MSDLGITLPDAIYGGIYANSGWSPDVKWSYNRHGIVRAMQKDNRVASLGIMDEAESLFHRIFGERGTTEFEMETLSERRDLQGLIAEVTAALATMPPDDIPGAQAVLANANRLVNQYPDNPADFAAWRLSVANITPDLKRYIPFNWAPWVIGIAALAGLGLYAHSKGWLGGARQNPRRRRKSRRRNKRWSGTKVQSLLLPTGSYSKAQAKAWAKSHGYRYGKVDTTANYHRLRQAAPVRGKQKRTITFGKGIKAIVEQR